MCSLFEADVDLHTRVKISVFFSAYYFEPLKWHVWVKGFIVDTNHEAKPHVVMDLFTKTIIVPPKIILHFGWVSEM